MKKQHSTPATQLGISRLGVQIGSAVLSCIPNMSLLVSSISCDLRLNVLHSFSTALFVWRISALRTLTG
uniref:Uncharacterized protein n=1 Tax=Setaria digitata TaxID=48799 RepID=A0A915PNT9_9BILA